LRHVEPEGNTRQERKDPAPPPIFVPRITNMQRLTATIEQVVNRSNYTLKIINNDTVKIITTKLEYHKVILDILKDKKVEFHTYQARQHRAYRVVIRNLQHSVQLELAREDIERMGHKIRNLWNIRHRVTGNPLSLFFLDIEPADNNNEIYHIEYLQTMRVRIEPPHQKKNNIPQCKRCQAYFHTKVYCEHRPRCVKCGKSHSTEECTLPKAQPAKCLHCYESHPASYRGCKVYQEIIR
jgi:hypothetical protein